MEPNAKITGYRAIDDTANAMLSFLRPEDQARLRKELKNDADRYSSNVATLASTSSTMTCGAFSAKVE
jgi:hypothetical protein